MMKWYFAFLAIVVICLVVLIVQFGLNPRPKPIIKPSNFSEPEIIGQTIYRQLHKDIHLFNLVAFGVNHHINLDVILGLLNASEKYGHPFQQVLILNHLKSEWEKKIRDTPLSKLKVESLSGKNYKIVLEFLKKQQISSQKTLIIANPGDIFHLEDQSLIRFLESDLSLSILSFIHVGCELELKKIKEFQTFCRRQTQKTSSFSHLSCLAYQKSAWLKKLKTKKFDKNKNVIFLEQYGLLDYVYFTYLPRVPDTGSI